MMRHEDGTVHFSHLKQIALSPLHYKTAVETPYPGTPAMMIGSCVHSIVLGQRPAFPVIRWGGADRKARGWKEFREGILIEHPNATIVTPKEFEKAEAIATAVLTDPVAGPLIAEVRETGRFEVPIKWEDSGVACSTGGIDMVGGGWIGDLKTTRTAHPERFQFLCKTMRYFEQMKWLQNGAKLNGIDTSKGLKILGVENTPPYAVTVLNLLPSTIAEAQKSLALWLERFRACEAANAWPGYQQCEVDVDSAAGTWDQEEEDDDESEPEAAA